MSVLTDLIKEKAGEVLAGNVSIPEDLKEKVMGGVSDAIFGSVKETAAQEGGIAQLTSLFTGESSAASSPVTALAGKLFSGNIAEKLGLSPTIVNAIVPMIPKVIELVTSGKGLDVSELLSEVSKGGVADMLKEKAGSLLGGLFKGGSIN